MDMEVDSGGRLTLVKVETLKACLHLCSHHLKHLVRAFPFHPFYLLSARADYLPPYCMVTGCRCIMRGAAMSVHLRNISHLVREGDEILWEQSSHDEEDHEAQGHDLPFVEVLLVN